MGCLVGSDGTCPSCKAGLEQFCPNMVLTYGSPDKHLGGFTYGGYSDSIVVDERYVVQRPVEPQSRRRRASAVCGNHRLFAPAPLERDGKARRPGWWVLEAWVIWG